MMKSSSKPSAASDIGSEDRLFTRARLHLTALYLLILLLIVAAMSAVLYYELGLNIRDAFEGDNPSAVQNVAVIHAMITMRTTILVTDAVILLIAGAFSYAFAGRTMRPIKESLIRQKRFSSDASHELRTPLTLLRANIEVAQMNKTLKKQERAVLQNNLEEVEHMSALVDQLLVLSRQDAMQVRDVFDVADIVSRVVPHMQILAKKKNIDLRITHLEHGNVIGDPLAIERVIRNLLQNAIDYTEKGSVSLSVQTGPADVILTIADTGIGIDPADLPHVFERFYKADRSRTDNRTGSGLGLAIVQEIVLHHHGMIHIDSVLHKGTTVTLKLPHKSR